IRIGTTRHSNERRDDGGAEPLSDVGPSSTVLGLDEQELAVLRQVGGHWERVLPERRGWLRALPVDPSLHRFPSAPVAGRGGRLAEVDFVASDEAGEVIATPHAGGAPSGVGGAAARCRRVLLGPPLAGSA